MMYSRRFSEGVDLPPDYGGAAYRTRDQGAQSENERAADERRAEEQRANEAYEKAGLAGRSDPRRPLYEDKNGRRDPPEDRPAAGDLPRFSFSGRNFSLDDIILAGLILLLIGDRDGERRPDSELLLILGLLLLSK